MEIDKSRIEAAAAACQSGQKARFTEIYDAYARLIYAFVYRKTLNKEVSEDLTSKTFLKALKNIDKYQSDAGGFNAWLYAIARNNVIDYFRTEHQSDSIDSIFSLTDGKSASVEMDNRILVEKVSKLLENLDARQREVILLRLWQDLPFKEITDIAGVSTANAKMIFGRGLAKIRQDLMFVGAYILSLIANIWY